MKLKILNMEGHQELELAPEQALQKIKEEGEGKWIFVDGIYNDTVKITITALEQAGEVVITPVLQAG